MTRLVLHAASAAVLAWATSGWAQIIYKSTMPDGSVVYGAEPTPGAKRVETIKPKTEATGVQPVGPKDEKTLQQREMTREQQATRQNEVQQAEQALRDAEAAQIAGKEPLPGERQGTAGGASRLTDEYWERQKALAAAVAEARKRVDEMRGAAR
jgi:hypothetical protein